MSVNNTSYSTATVLFE